MDQFHRIPIKANVFGWCAILGPVALCTHRRIAKVRPSEKIAIPHLHGPSHDSTDKSGALIFSDQPTP